MRQIISGLLAVGCALTLAACSHSTADNLDTSGVIAPTPTTAVPSRSTATPITSTSATATTPLPTGAAVSPGEHPPTISNDVYHDNASGALAFAAYFYKALDWSIATTNPNLLRPISAPTCTACQKYIRGLDALAASGGHSEGGRISTTRFSITTSDLPVKATFVVEVTTTQQVEVLIDPPARPSTFAPTSNPAITYLYMDWQGSAWLAIQIEHQ